MKAVKTVIIPVLSAALIMSAFTGCSFKKEEAEETQEIEVSVESSKPVVKNISISYNFSGTVEANDVVNIIPKVAGDVIEKHYEVGDHVNEGDLLFKIDDTTAQIALKQAEAALTSAQAGLNSQVAVQASTYASATETLGKIPTNEQQLSTAVDSAYASAAQAGAQKDSANASSEYAKKAFEDAEKAVNDLTVARDNAKNAVAAAQSTGDEELVEEAMVAYQTAEANLTKAKSARDQAELQKKTNENSAKSAEMQYYVASEGVDNAIRNKNDYETYTVNSTLYGANAQMVGADAALTNSKASVEQAKAGVDNAKLALEYTTVTAPVSGTITAINISEHNMASQSQPAYVIQSDSKEKIVFYVAEETKKFINPGNTAIVTRNDTEYKAVIKNVENTIDSATGLFKVEAEPTENPDAFISGAIVNIRTITREAKNAITVPIESVYYDGEQAYVYAAEGGVAKRYDVSTGLSDENDIEITEGITPDKMIISTYSAQLKDGVKISEKK